MVTLKNDRLCLEISEIGAEIRRILFDGNDVLWSGDPAFWEGTAPVLFPMCGSCINDIYTLDGKEYSLPKHGFARTSVFSLEKRGNGFVTMLLKSTPETLKMYPFDFELRITYTLKGAALKVTYYVKNLTDRVMYFSIGSHEAYACPEGIEEYDVIFPQKETLNTFELDGSLLAHKTYPILKDSTTLPLYTEYFETDALIFKDIKSRSATLRNRKTGRAITVEFPCCDYLLVWTKPGAGYVCLEPWSGIPPMADDSNAIEEKEGIITLEAGEKYSAAHTIYF